MIALDWIGSALLVVLAVAVVRLMVISVREDRAAARREASDRARAAGYRLRPGEFVMSGAQVDNWPAAPAPEPERDSVFERHVREAVAMATPQPTASVADTPFTASTGCTVRIEDHATHRCVVIVGPGVGGHRMHALLPPLGMERHAAATARALVATHRATSPAHYLALAEYLESIAVEAAS